MKIIKKEKLCKVCGISKVLDKGEKPFHVKIRKNGPRVHMTASKFNKVISKVK